MLGDGGRRGCGLDKAQVYNPSGTRFSYRFEYMNVSAMFEL